MGKYVYIVLGELCFVSGEDTDLKGGQKRKNHNLVRGSYFRRPGGPYILCFMRKKTNERE